MVYSSDSPYFTIEKNGVVTTYNREEILENSNDYGMSSLLNTDSFATVQASYNTFLGQPYSSKELGAKSFSHKGSYKTARLYGSYDYYPNQYVSKTFKVFEFLSLIVGVMSMGMETVIALVGSGITVISGAMCISSSLNFEINCYR